MKIKISEVWNADGRSKELAVIDVEDVRGKYGARRAVEEWILQNRPDLQLADTIYAHGYHAIAI
jgi:hypothetical protein